MFWSFVFCFLFGGLVNADLIGYTPLGSNFTFVNSNSTVPLQNYVRSAAAFAVDSPAGTAIFGLSTSLLLTTSVSQANGARLCEWNITHDESRAPLRCVTLASASSGAPTDMVYVATNQQVLVSLPDVNSVLAVNYVTFQVASEPWMSTDHDATFLAPVALEYDPNGGVVYVALENADMIRRFAPNGVFLDSSAAPFVSIPRPRFMELARDAVPPSLYVLTSDLTLPELYQFRVPDGASLATLANDDGDWYPAYANDSSVRSIAISPSARVLYTLYQDAAGIASDVVTSFSLLSADNLGATSELGQLTSLTYDAPIAFVRNEPTVSWAIGGVVDARSWTPTASGSPRLFFDACTPGMASGATLDGDSIVRVLACNETTLLVADYRSVYLLSNNGSALCYQAPVVDIAGAEITDATLFNSSTLFFFTQNYSSSWNIYVVSDVCSAATNPTLLQNSAALAATLPPYATNVSRFARSNSSVCVLRLDSTAQLACSDGTFVRLVNSSLEGALGAAWDTRRDLLWISFRNGTLLLVNVTNHLELHTILPAQKTLPPLSNFLFDSVSGIASWISAVPLPTTSKRSPAAESVAAEYSWVSAVYDNEQDLLAAKHVQYRTVRVLGNYTTGTFATFLAVAGPIVISTESSHCPLMTSCDDMEMIAGGIFLVLFFVFWILLLMWIYIRRRRRQRQGWRLASTSDPEILVPESNGQSAERRHFKGCRPIRELIRGVFCFCRCCYDPDTGYLLCCFPCIGGRWKGSFQPLRDMRNDVDSFVDVGDSSVSHHDVAGPEFSIADRNDPSSQPPPAAADPSFGGDVHHDIDLNDNRPAPALIQSDDKKQS